MRYRCWGASRSAAAGAPALHGVVVRGDPVRWTVSFDATTPQVIWRTSSHLTFWAAIAEPGSPSESAFAALSATGVAAG